MIHSSDLTEGGGEGRRWSFADVMQKMYDEDRTGVLDVSGPNMNWDIHIRKGHVVRVEVLGGVSWLLGDVLEASGMLTSAQLVKAERIAMKTGSSLGEVLVVKGMITHEALSRAYELQVRESLLPLFRRVGITCRFKKETPLNRPGAKPLPISYLVGEARRRNKLWPLLEERIPGSEAVYQCVRGTAKEVFRTSTGNTGNTSTTSALTDIVDGDGGVSGSEKIVYYHLNGRKSVGTLALFTALGEFETTLAISRMLGRGVVVRTMNPEPHWEEKSKSVFPIVYQMLFYGVLGAFLIFLGLSFFEGGAFHGLEDGDSEIHQTRVENERQRIGRSLEIYLLEKAEYPGALEDLVAANLLTPEELERYASDLNYRASTSKDRYDLEVKSKPSQSEDD